jgi:hypothetical protein
MKKGKVGGRKALNRSTLTTLGLPFPSGGKMKEGTRRDSSFLDQRKSKTQKIIARILMEEPDWALKPPMGETSKENSKPEEAPKPPQSPSPREERQEASSSESVKARTEIVTGKNWGWVKLHRAQFGHEISEGKPWCDGYAWSYLYAMANHKPGVVNFRNQYIPVERGQFITSMLRLCTVFGWGRRRLKSFLQSLKNRGMCTYRSTNRFLVVTICNYNRYQGREEEKEQTEEQTEIEVEEKTEVGRGEQTEEQTGSKQGAINKKYRRKNNTRGDSPNPAVKDFISFWCESFKGKFGTPYTVNGGKDGNLVKKLLAIHSPERLKELANAFFKSEDAFIKKSGYTIGAFYSQINKLVAEKSQRKNPW